jgi:hypothetical protein
VLADMTGSLWGSRERVTWGVKNWGEELHHPAQGQGRGRRGRVSPKDREGGAKVRQGAPVLPEVYGHPTCVILHKLGFYSFSLSLPLPGMANGPQTQGQSLGEQG